MVRSYKKKDKSGSKGQRGSVNIETYATAAKEVKDCLWEK